MTRGTKIELEGQSYTVAGEVRVRPSASGGEVAQCWVPKTLITADKPYIVAECPPDPKKGIWCIVTRGDERSPDPDGEGLFQILLGDRIIILRPSKSF